MACIPRVPRCGEIEVTEEPINEFAGWVSLLFTIIGIIASLLKYEAIATFVSTVVGAIGGIAVGAVIAGIIGAAIVFTVVFMYWKDRCTEVDTPVVCVAGVVHQIVQDFNGILETIFPFTAMHDRVDLIVKSNYWDIVENNAVKVFCTEEAEGAFRKSEIMRCYYFTPRVCNVATGALIGAGVGGAIGVVVGAIIAVIVVGCSTVVLCLLAILVAALIAAAAALAGAIAGGYIAKAASDAQTPGDDSGTEISVGDLLTANGNLATREFDEGANVLWWVNASSLSGRAPDSIPNNPFSYCEINDVFAMDACPVIIE